MNHVIDNRIIQVSFSDGATVYLIPETKRLVDLNAHLDANEGLTYSIEYIEKPSEQQRADAKSNETAKELFQAR